MTNDEKLASPKRLVIFVRENGFYPLEIPEATIEDNAKCNHGTLRVEDALTGEILWQNVKGMAPGSAVSDSEPTNPADR